MKMQIILQINILTEQNVDDTCTTVYRFYFKFLLLCTDI